MNDRASTPPPDDEVTHALRSLGISDEAIAQAVERGDPGGAIFDAVLLPAIAERTVSAADIERQGGLEVAETQAFMQALGLPAPAPEDPAFTADEARVFVALEELKEVWPQELAIQLARVYGRLLSRIAQTTVQLFRLYAEPRLRAEGSGPLAQLRAVQEAVARLLPLADPLLLGVHRRWVEHELAQAAASEAEGQALPGTLDVTFLFCDLKDFTAFAHSEGDAAAVAAIDRFAEVVVRERGDRFRFMKSLGDGFMLAYTDVPAATAAGARIIEAMHAPAFPAVHASLHRGVVIAREGDFFGTTVNIAARLLDVAGRDELVATRPIVECAGEAFKWEAVGTRRVRGMSEPLEVFRLQPQRGTGGSSPQ